MSPRQVARNHCGNGARNVAIEEVVKKSGLQTLGQNPSTLAIQKALENLADRIAGADRLTRQRAEVKAIQALKAAKIPKASALVDAALSSLPTDSRGDEAVQGSAVEFTDPEPADGPQDGDAILRDVEALFNRYLVLKPGAATAMATWAVLTWIVSHVRIAPILTLLSATKQCGKSVTLELLNFLVRRPVLAAGVTPAVLFRLNEANQPTFLVDEAERLNRLRSDGTDELISLLNAGHRRGGKVYRVEGDQREVRAFDAFGFRAVAAIGTVVDTIVDRSIVIEMERAPQGSIPETYSYDRARHETADLVGRIARWAMDNGKAIASGISNAPRPDWLGHRGSDNWATLFALAAIAGGGALDRVLNASKLLTTTRDGGAEDARELLIHDLRHVFGTRNNPARIATADILNDLNGMEDRPWPEWRGKNLTGSGLASLLRPFKVKPQEYRPGEGAPKERGYLLADLEPVFQRYPPRQNPGQSGQFNNDNGSWPAESRDGGPGLSRLVDPASRCETTTVPAVPTVPRPVTGLDRWDESDPFAGLDEEEVAA